MGKVSEIAREALERKGNGSQTPAKVDQKPVAIPKTLKAMQTTDLNRIFDLYSLQIQALLPKHLDPEKVLKVFAAYVRRNQDVAACSTESVIGALLQCAELGFIPSPALKQVFFTPRNNRHTGMMELEFGMQYQGKLDLIYRSGQVSNIRTRIVYANDEFEIHYGDAEQIIHRPRFENRGEPVGVYLIAELKDGQTVREFMTREEVEHVRNSSDAYRREKSKSPDQRYGPWFKHETEMWRKTVLNRGEKWLPKSLDYVKATITDGKVITPNISEADLLAEEPEIGEFEEISPVATGQHQSQDAAEGDYVSEAPDSSETDFDEPASKSLISEIRIKGKQKKSKMEPDMWNALETFLGLPGEQQSAAIAQEWIDVIRNL